jgi:hypothetical protein
MANESHNGKKSYLLGPYKGSKENGGREIYVRKTKGPDGKWHTTSTNRARQDLKNSGRKVSKDQDVDHKDNNKNNNSASNLQAMAKSKNVAKGNVARTGTKAKASAKKAVATKKGKK